MELIDTKIDDFCGQNQCQPMIFLSRTWWLSLSSLTYKD
jgi:hypothetical protein